jgi:acetyl esterase/lipase
MTRRMGGSVLVAISACGLWVAAVPVRGADIVIEKDIVYGTGGGKDLKLNLARPEQTNGLVPGIVYVHGGGWIGGDRKLKQGDIEDAARRGYVAVTVAYRLSDPDASGKPRNPFPAQIEDVKCAIRWLRANAAKYHVDPDHIGVTGDSAGGHLSLLAGVTGSASELEGNGGHPDTSSKVQAVVNYFGPTDMARLHKISKRAAGVIENVLGGPPEKVPDVYKAASPVTYVSKDDPPILTIHGTADPIVPVEQAHEFDEAMKKVGGSHTMMLIQGAQHGFGDEAGKRAREATFKFFDEHLKNKG